MIIDDVLYKNVALKAKYSGRRCFIVGCGPSLNQQDLTLLRDEVVISTSAFYKHPDAAVVKPEFWVMADPLHWEQPEKHLFPIIEGINQKGISTKLFLPAKAIPLFCEIAYGVLIEPHFYQLNHGNFEFDEIDFSKKLPPLAQNVMCPALMLAIYLGCPEIYFIGCDHDWWGWEKNMFGKYIYTHFSGVKENTIMQTDFSFEGLMKTVDKQRDQYRTLFEYAKSLGVNVFNATNGGHLDIFPRVEYESLFDLDN